MCSLKTMKAGPQTVQTPGMSWSAPYQMMGVLYRLLAKKFLAPSLIFVCLFVCNFGTMHAIPLSLFYKANVLCALSQLKWKNQSQSMCFTSLQDTTTNLVAKALGVTECEERPGILQLLIEDGDKVLQMEEGLWAPFKMKMMELPFCVNLVIRGKTVLKVDPCQGQSSHYTSQ